MSPRQRDLLEFIARYQHEHRGVSPSFAEMATAVSVASKSNVHRLLAGLEADGRITRRRNGFRAITIIAPDTWKIDQSGAAVREVEGIPTDELNAEITRRGLLVSRPC